MPGHYTALQISPEEKAQDLLQQTKDNAKALAAANQAIYYWKKVRLILKRLG